MFLSYFGMDFTRELELLIRARYPLILVRSSEESRVVDLITRLAESLGKRLVEWTCSFGLTSAGSNVQSHKARNPATKDPLLALEQVLEQIEPALFLFKDLHPFLTRNHPVIVRRLKDIAIHLRHSHKTLILLSPSFEVPSELEKELTCQRAVKTSHEWADQNQPL